MRRYDGRAASERWAKNPRRAARPELDVAAAAQLEANDMSLGWVSTPSSSNRPTSRG